MKIKLSSVFLLMLTFGFSNAQDQSISVNPGSAGIGMRTSSSVFLGDNAAGFGAGGQIKILFSNRVNSEWFLDYMNSSAGLNGYRKDTHIGWSVQFAVNKGGYQTRMPVPFVEAGQCFDWTTVGFVKNNSSENAMPQTSVRNQPVFSAATQAGAGVAWFPISRLELNAQVQYMIHLGKDVHLEFDDDNYAYEISQSKGTSFDGHILGTISISWYLIQPQKKRA